MRQIPIRARATSFARTAFVLACCAVIAACSGPRDEQGDLDQTIYGLAASGAPGQAIDLGPAFGEDWDRVLMFDGEPSSATVSGALGFDWPDYSPGMGDGTTVAIVRGREIVRWGYLPSSNSSGSGAFVEVEMADPWIELSPGRTTFIVESIIPAGPIYLCYSTCPA